MAATQSGGSQKGPVRGGAARKRRHSRPNVASQLAPQPKTFRPTTSELESRIPSASRAATASGVAGAVVSRGEQSGVTIHSFISSQLPTVSGVGYSNLHQQSTPATPETSTQPSSTPQGVTPPRGVTSSQRVTPPRGVTPDTGSGASCSNHVLQTDRATGQVEELTPLNSPRLSLPSLGEILNDTSSEPPPTVSGQPVAQELSPLQQSLCEDLQCPLPLPDWLVAGMTRVQAMTAHTPSVPPHCRKKGEEEAPPRHVC